jgi:peptidyl-prolyl cis-trans isomerase SurA
VLRRLRPVPFFALLVALLAWTLLVAAGDAVMAQDARLADRILAVVDGDPVLESDVERAIALGLVEPGTGEGDRELRRRILDGLIEQRLRVHEVDRYGFGQVPVELIDEQVAAIRARFATPEDLDQRLARLGMTKEGLAQLVAQQLQVLIYVDELLGARVFVGLEEIEAHYQRVLVPQLRQTGQPVPPLEDVREQIREVLRQQRLNEELDTWTTDLRRKADVQDYFDRPQRSLPPKVGQRP